MTTIVNRKADFFYKTNRFESIRITNRIDSNRELECSSTYRLGVYKAGFKCVETLDRIIIRGPYPPSNAIIYMHFYE